MQRYASLCEVRWEEVNARTVSRPQLLQAAQPLQQRQYAGRTRLHVMRRVHRAVRRVDGLAQARRAWFGGATHLQAHQMSSGMKISPTNIEAVTGRCDMGEHLRATDRRLTAHSSQTCLPERIGKSCCTCSQVAAVAVDEVGAKNFRWWRCSPGPCASDEPLRDVS